MSGWGGVAGPAAGAIHSTFAAATIDVLPNSGPPLTNISAIWFDYAGDDPFGDGRSVRQRGYEVQKSDVPNRPLNGTIIVAVAGRFRVIEVRDVQDALAWAVMVESE